MMAQFYHLTTGVLVPAFILKGCVDKAFPSLSHALQDGIKHQFRILLSLT